MKMLRTTPFFTKLYQRIFQNQAGGPPDLDEVFRDMKKKLRKFMSDMANEAGKNNPPDGDGQSPQLPKLPLPVLGGVLAAIVFIGWLLSGLYVVDFNERAVVTQFGRFTSVSEPGLNLRLPYPFQAHEFVNFSSTRTFEVGAVGRSDSKNGVQMLTGDENILLVHYTVQYMVNDAPNYVFNDVAPDATVRLLAETAMREVVGSSTLDKVLYEDREDVAKRARDIMQEVSNKYAIGVNIIRVNLQSVSPPEQVQAAFDDSIMASQDRLRQVSEGEAYSQLVVPRAKGQAARLIEEAEGYKQSVVAKAEGEASRFTQVYLEYKGAKEVTRERMYMDAVGGVLAKSKKVIIDSNSKSFISLGDVSNPSTLPASRFDVRAVSEEAERMTTNTGSSTFNPNSNTAHQVMKTNGMKNNNEIPMRGSTSVDRVRQR